MNLVQKKQLEVFNPMLLKLSIIPCKLLETESELYNNVVLKKAAEAVTEENLFLNLPASSVNRLQLQPDTNLSVICSETHYPDTVVLGKWEIRAWYHSPFPPEFLNSSRLFFCEFCLKYSKTNKMLRRHQSKCTLRNPPGTEIYRDENISVFEVDGNISKTYCQHLCLLAILFLETKTLYLDVETFFFYILTYYNKFGYHFIGYFSKQKCNYLTNINVSCIMVLPPYQRRGYGRFLIDFSYLLSREENRPGTPEQPFSAAGKISYHSYWKSVVIQYLYKNKNHPLYICDISKKTGLMEADVIETLMLLGFAKYGKLVENTDCKLYTCINWATIEEYHAKFKRCKYRIQIDTKCLKWKPYISRNSILKLSANISSKDKQLENNNKTSEIPATPKKVAREKTNILDNNTIILEKRTDIQISGKNNEIYAAPKSISTVKSKARIIENDNVFVTNVNSLEKNTNTNNPKSEDQVILRRSIRKRKIPLIFESLSPKKLRPTSKKKVIN